MPRLIIKHLPSTIVAWITNNGGIFHSSEQQCYKCVCHVPPTPPISVDPSSGEVGSSFGALFFQEAWREHKHQQTKITSLPH